MTERRIGQEKTKVENAEGFLTAIFLPMPENEEGDSLEEEDYLNKLKKTLKGVKRVETVFEEEFVSSGRKRKIAIIEKGTK